MKNPKEYAAELMASFGKDKDAAFNAFYAGIETGKALPGMSRQWCAEVVRAIYKD